MHEEYAPSKLVTACQYISVVSVPRLQPANVATPNIFCINKHSPATLQSRNCPRPRLRQSSAVYKCLYQDIMETLLCLAVRCPDYRLRLQGQSDPAVMPTPFSSIYEREERMLRWTGMPQRSVIPSRFFFLYIYSFYSAVYDPACC